MRQVSVAAVTDLKVQLLSNADYLDVTLVCPMYLAGWSPSPRCDWRYGSEAMSPRTSPKDLPPPPIDPANSV